jgi:methyltransferase (TIGR00027 family)
MQREEGSWTAEGVALFRALESIRPEGERRCYDPMAKEFLNAWFRLVCRSRVSGGIARIYVGLRHGRAAINIVARTTYIDYKLQVALDEGLEQLVILGAGFDSRAYRFEDLKGPKVKVFEVDHPATQKRKVERVERILGRLPGHVTYVPVDFERKTLEERLIESGYDPGLKTMFIWEGVVVYLPQESVDETLAFIAENSGMGSSVIFDYAYESLMNSTDENAKAWRAYLEHIGEPPKFGIAQGSIAEFLGCRGLTLVEEWTDEILKGARFSRFVKSPFLAQNFSPHGGICLCIKP